MSNARRAATAALAALAVAGLQTATAQAAVKRAHVLVAGPVTVKAYKLYLFATPKNPRDPAKVTAIFERGTDNNRQDHYYSFSRGVSVKISKDGSSAKIDGKFGVYGHIHLTFTSGGNGGQLPRICNGSTVGHHSGVLAGGHGHGFDINTYSSYFGDVVENSFPAFITTVVGKTPGCTPKKSKPTKGVTELSTTAMQAGRALTSFTASRTQRGYIVEDVLLIDSAKTSSGPVVLHDIYAAGLPASAFSAATDLSSAHAGAGGSFLTGAFDFTGTVQSGPGFEIGSTSGTLDAHFDGIGVVQPQTNVLVASLSQ
jgi:hypothetical protein